MNNNIMIIIIIISNSNKYSYNSYKSLGNSKRIVGFFFAAQTALSIPRTDDNHSREAIRYAQDKIFSGCC